MRAPVSLSLVTTGLCGLLVLGALGQGCTELDEPGRSPLNSFKVEVAGIYTLGVGGGPRVPVTVVSACAAAHGGEASVPAELRGTRACPYAIPRGDVELDVAITALGRDGKPYDGFSGPVSFRVVPGDLTGDYGQRWTKLENGVGTGTVRAAHLYSEVRVWVEDAPVQLILTDGGVGGSADQLPEEPEQRSFATGLSPSLFFEDPTIAKVQIPDGFDNRTSPLIGQFLTIGRAPENGTPITQSCTDDPTNDKQPAKLVVTGTDPQGFFVTDATACRMKELVLDPVSGDEVRTPEPDGYYPGTFGAMFIYNYSFPEGLDQGDVLWAVAGAVQEFSGTTQLVFPSWIIREKARALPEDQWLRHLEPIKPVDLNLRLCGLDDNIAPFVTDTMCGHNRRNLKLESLESALVRIRRVKVPQVFTSCDRDGDGEVPFFCESTSPIPGCEEGGQQSCNQWLWRSCDFENPWDPTAASSQETACNIACTTSANEYASTVCAERSTFVTFGQFSVEMAGPGPAAAGLDDSLPKRMEAVTLGAASVTHTTPFAPGTEVRVWCTAPARMKAGAGTVVATASDEQVAANTLVSKLLAAGETNLAFLGTGAAGTCTVAPNPKTRIAIVTRDALPQLEPDCQTEGEGLDPEKVKQCQNFRGATYDIVGHLRQLQAGRPRWIVLPRDTDDVCCYPGPGLECPASIKPCP